MGIVFNELKAGWQNLLAIGIILAAWIVSFIDLFTNVFKGAWITTTLVLTVVISLGGLVRLTVRDQKKKSLQKRLAEEAERCEPKLEEKIRKLAEDPEFITACYLCVYFNQEIRLCNRLHDGENLREIRIDGKKYCLYWEKITGPETAPVDNGGQLL